MNSRQKNIISWSIIILLFAGGVYFFGFKPGDEQLINNNVAIDHSIETIKERTTSYEITAHYPVFEGLESEVLEKINDQSRDFIEKEIASYKNEAGEGPSIDDSSGGVFNADSSVVLESGNIISVRYNISSYISGAAHPFNFVRGLNLNAKTGDPILLSNILEDSYLDRLSDLTRSKLLQQRALNQETIDQQQEQWIREGTSPKEENFSSYVLSPDAVIFFFNPYQVAPYADGIIEVIVPYEDIKGLIKDGSPIEPLLTS